MLTGSCVGAVEEVTRLAREMDIPVNHRRDDARTFQLREALINTNPSYYLNLTVRSLLFVIFAFFAVKFSPHL
jgi:hypothetical protein